MATTLTYLVIPLTAKGDGGVRPGEPHRLIDRDDALVVAGRTSVYASGVIVLEEEADPAIDFWAEPRLVTHFGRLPQDLLETLAA